jgi:histidinol-phosphate aminotransferase
MLTNRRTWLKQAAVMGAAAYLAKFETIAAPLLRVQDLPDGAAIRLKYNENPYGCSSLAIKAMMETLSSSNRYPWDKINELIASIAQSNNVEPENVIIGAGSTQLIDLVIQYAALKPGYVVLANPTFSRWESAAQKAGLQKIEIPLTKNKVHDLHAMFKAIEADTQMVYICNPNNPTGTVCDYKALTTFINEATKKTVVLIDEAYLDYAQAKSVSDIAVTNKNLVVVKTFSKIYGLAGARIGYAVSHKETIEQLSQLQSGIDFGVSAASIAGALASLKDDDFVKQSYDSNEKVRGYTTTELEKLNIHCIPSHTNFIYFSLAEYKADFFDRLKQHNIDGTGIFEENGKWSRITMGTMAEMQQFIAALQ